MATKFEIAESLAALVSAETEMRKLRPSSDQFPAARLAYLAAYDAYMAVKPASKVRAASRAGRRQHAEMMASTRRNRGL